MNATRWMLLVSAALASVAGAKDRVLPYEAFGPQVVAHELIGMEWWQWDSHGDSEPRKYPIKVVVYWNQSLEETKKRYPVVREKEQDYRYVEYETAKRHLAEKAKDLSQAGLDSARLEEALKLLESARRTEEK
jgi:hypothetical protein